MGNNLLVKYSTGNSKYYPRRTNESIPVPYVTFRSAWIFGLILTCLVCLMLIINSIRNSISERKQMSDIVVGFIGLLAMFAFMALGCHYTLP